MIGKSTFWVYLTRNWFHQMFECFRQFRKVYVNLWLNHLYERLPLFSKQNKRKTFSKRHCLQKSNNFRIFYFFSDKFSYITFTIWRVCQCYFTIWQVANVTFNIWKKIFFFLIESNISNSLFIKSSNWNSSISNIEEF